MPVYITTPLYLPIAYCFTAVSCVIRTELIGPASTFLTPFKNAKTAKVVKATVGSSALRKVPILAHRTTYPPPKKPYVSENMSNGGSERATPQSAKIAIAQIRGDPKRDLGPESGCQKDKRMQFGRRLPSSLSRQEQEHRERVLVPMSLHMRASIRK